MKKTNRKQKALQQLKPTLKWQTGPYSQQAEYRFTLPYPFLLLCKLMEVTPEDLLCDFMDNLACGAWKREGRDKAKEHLMNYFIEHGYGQQHYSEADIRQLFKEMDAPGLLFPKNNKSKLINLYTQWRDKQYTHWFKYWVRKPRRKLSQSNAV